MPSSDRCYPRVRVMETSWPASIRRKSGACDSPPGGVLYPGSFQCMARLVVFSGSWLPSQLCFPTAAWCSGMACRLTVVASEIVPGDVLYIKSGNKLPADVRFVEISSDAKFDRSILTGV